MRNGEPIHFCSGGWKHRDDDCHCPCSFCHLYSQQHEWEGIDTIEGLPTGDGRDAHNDGTTDA